MNIYAARPWLLAPQPRYGLPHPLPTCLRLLSWSRRSRAENDAEPNEMDSIEGRHHEPAGRTGELSVLIPTSSLENLVLAARWPDWIRESRRRIGRKPIEAPLPNVAVHVI